MHALSRTDLTVGDGEFVVLLGPSGCGKTTMLRMIAGLIEPTSARSRSEGGASGGATDDVKRWCGELGMVFQDANLFPWLSIEDNIALPLKLRGVRAASDGSAGRAHRARRPRRFRQNAIRASSPGGMQQRAAIVARARPTTRHPPHGRAVRRARRDDARADERRAAADLDEPAARPSSSSPTRSPKRCSWPTASSCSRRGRAASRPRRDLPFARPRGLICSPPRHSRRSCASCGIGWAGWGRGEDVACQTTFARASSCSRVR